MIPSKHRLWLLLFFLFLAMSVAGMSFTASERPASAWVYAGPDGKLIYKTTPAGDRILDFSHAGYMGGGVSLPSVPVGRTIHPSGGQDNTAEIQAAIDAVASMPLQNGFRGAVLLGQGTFTCSKTITISATGIVLRGSGSGPGGTTIRMTGDPHAAIVIGGRRRSGDENRDAEKNAGLPQTTIADTYVPAGSVSFMLTNASGFADGDFIEIRRPTTPAWVKFMRMDDMVRDGKPQTWIATTRNGVHQRRITGLSGSKVTLDVPLSDSYEARTLNPPGTIVVKIIPPQRITQVGVENLRIQCPPLEIEYGKAPYSAFRIGGDDCWVQDVFCEETMNTSVLTGQRITMQRVVVKHTFPNLGASKPADFSIEGSQILLDRCESTGGNTYFVWTGSLTPGPNVVLNCTFRGHGSRIQPHQRWATGMLVDNCTIPDGGIDYPNRGVAGSGHGWTMGWGVVWNSIAKFYVIQNPPGTVNWAIGSIGERIQTARYFDTGPVIPDGTFESHGQPVTPQSLYLAQLEDRLGPQALKNLGYSSNTESMVANKSVPPLPPLRTDNDNVLGPDLALHRPVNTSNVRGTTREFGGERAVNADSTTYWATNDDVTEADLIVDTEGPLEINAVALEEATGLEGRVQEYKVEGQVDSDWRVLSHGTTIGKRKVDRFPKATVWKARLTILKASAHPALRKFGIYLGNLPR